MCVCVCVFMIDKSIIRGENIEINRINNLNNYSLKLLEKKVLQFNILLSLLIHRFKY